MTRGGSGRKRKSGSGYAAALFVDQVALEGEPTLIPSSWPQIWLGYYLRELGRGARPLTMVIRIEL